MKRKWYLSLLVVFIIIIGFMFYNKKEATKKATKNNTIDDVINITNKNTKSINNIFGKNNLTAERIEELRKSTDLIDLFSIITIIAEENPGTNLNLLLNTIALRNAKNQINLDVDLIDTLEQRVDSISNALVKIELLSPVVLSEMTKMQKEKYAIEIHKKIDGLVGIDKEKTHKYSKYLEDNELISLLSPDRGFDVYCTLSRFENCVDNLKKGLKCALESVDDDNKVWAYQLLADADKQNKEKYYNKGCEILNNSSNMTTDQIQIRHYSLIMAAYNGKKEQELLYESVQNSDKNLKSYERGVRYYKDLIFEDIYKNYKLYQYEDVTGELNEEGKSN